jgi:hypothetical protein
MGIRLPLTTVLDYNDTPQTGAGSVAGGVAKTFQIPQDTDNVVVKLTASVIAGGVSATFQTTDDGGTTWYDVARTSIVSNANTTTAEFLSIPVIGVGFNPGRPVTGSVLTTIGSAAASTLGVSQFNGLPIMSTTGRIFLRYTNAVTSTDLARVQVKVNSKSSTQ